jgi:hypothetical protein
MRYSIFATAFAGLLSQASAQEPARVATSDVKALMAAAIDAEDGAAHGVLTGDAAAAITARFGAGTPIFIDVSTERRYRQPGCSRLNVRFWQDGVTLPAASQPRRQTVEFHINYCRDGQPPLSLSPLSSLP